MPRIKTPLQGSRQYWPRKRAADIVARIRTWNGGKDVKLLGFPAYKVGMTHAIITDNKPTSITKNDDIQVPLTVIECPPVKVAAITLYSKDAYGLHPIGQITAEKLDKDVSRTLILPKKPSAQPNTTTLADVRVLIHTQPKLTGIGAKAPDILEIGIGGTNAQEKLTFAQSILGKEIKINDVFAEGQVIDVTAISKGKGFQGPVKRFGVALRSHKSEKTKRGPGSIGPWHGLKGYKTPHAGQHGFQQRIEYNKHIIKISDDLNTINPKGGYLRYGLIKNQYALVKGSLIGASKRLITLTAPRRAPIKHPKEAPSITYLSLTSHQ